MLPLRLGYTSDTFHIFALLLIGLITACSNVVEDTEPPVKQYRIGGIVTGLQGNGLILQNNAQDNLLLATNGSSTFTFNTPLPDGS